MEEKAAMRERHGGAVVEDAPGPWDDWKTPTPPWKAGLIIGVGVLLWVVALIVSIAFRRAQ